MSGTEGSGSRRVIKQVLAGTDNANATPLVMITDGQPRDRAALLITCKK